MTVEELIEELKRLPNGSKCVLQIIPRNQHEENVEADIDRVQKDETPNTFLIVGYE